MTFGFVTHNLIFIYFILCFLLSLKLGTAGIPSGLEHPCVLSFLLSTHTCCLRKRLISAFISLYEFRSTCYSYCGGKIDWLVSYLKYFRHHWGWKRGQRAFSSDLGVRSALMSGAQVVQGEKNEKERNLSQPYQMLMSLVERIFFFPWNLLYWNWQVPSQMLIFFLLQILIWFMQIILQTTQHFYVFKVRFTILCTCPSLGYICTKNTGQRGLVQIPETGMATCVQQRSVRKKIMAEGEHDIIILRKMLIK